MYTLNVNKEQLIAINHALEIAMRAELAQFTILLEETFPNKCRNDDVIDVAKQLEKIIVGNGSHWFGLGSKECCKDNTIIYDMLQVVRNQLYKESEYQNGGVASSVCNLSNQPLITITNDQPKTTPVATPAKDSHLMKLRDLQSDMMVDEIRQRKSEDR